MEDIIRDITNDLAAGRSGKAWNVEDVASRLGLDRHGVFDRVAATIAEDFLSGTMAFDSADLAANDLFAWSCCLNDPLQGFAFRVFQAFDAGEEFHNHDANVADPIAANTIPQLQSALVSWKSAPD